MLYNKKPSMFEMAQRQSIQEFYDKNQDGTVMKISAPMTNDKSIAIPIDIDNDITKKLLTELRAFVPLKSVENTFVKPHQMIDQITNNLIEIDAFMDFKSCINTIYNVYKDIGKEKFYGAFLVNKAGNKINPLHPLVSMEMMAKEDKDEYKIYIYTYPEEKRLDSPIRNSARAKDKAKVKENVAAQIAVYSNKLNMAQTVSSNKNLNELIQEFNNGNEPYFNVESKYTITDSNNKAIKKTPMLMVPITLINKGLIMPWYGTCVITMNGSSKGHHVSPMMSANLGASYSHTDTNDSTYPSNSICTGRENSRTIKGLRTLNHSNLNSPLNRNCLTTGWRDYVEECVAFSFMAYESLIEDYDGAAIVEDMAVPTFKNYLEEWKHNNPEGTMKEYISHLKERKKDKEA